ncbi:hypothetical protein CSOJ01_12987 [Colletotrichum sojae]|uniref:Uncharacterized protein n=1 Tax=Colletotrichum sojae TaxID=2175907 RepID=A0A8H6ITH6_9PEZI|nr:hypothetical protein CSOJ01_12987 [Colletotrichum sojae]
MGSTLKLRGHHETKTQTVETRQDPVRREKTTEKPRAQPETKTQPTNTEHDPIVAPLQLRRLTADYRDLEKMQAPVARHEAARNEKKTEKPRDHHETKTQPAQAHDKKTQAVETRQEPAAPVLRLRRETANPLDLQKMQATLTQQEPVRHEKTETPREHREQNVQTTETPQEPISHQPQWERRQTADARDLQKMKDIAAQWEAACNEKKTKEPRVQPEKDTQSIVTRQDPVVPTLRLRRETADHRDLEKMQTRQDPAPVPTKLQTTTAATAPAKPAVLVKTTDKIRDFFEKKTQPAAETGQPTPLQTAPRTTAVAPAAPAKSIVVAKTEERGGQQHKTETEKSRDHYEMKTQPTDTRQDSAVPQPLKITKNKDHDEKRTEEKKGKPGDHHHEKKTQPTETRQDPAPPRPSPAAQQTATTAAHTAAAAPQMSAVMAKAAVKSQSNHANVLERYNRTGDRQRYADVSERNPFRSVSPLRKPTRNNHEGWSGHQMNTSDWPPEKPQEPEVKEASGPAAAAQEPSRRPSVLAQVEACVQKVRGGKGIHTPVGEITKIWHKIRRDDDTKTNQDQTVAMFNVPPTREDDETAEKMERAKQEDELKKKFWEKLDRTLGLHQVRPHDDRNGDKNRREKGRISLLIAKVLIGLMGLSFFGWLVTMVALIVNQKSLERLEFILWPVLTVVGLVFSGSALVRAQENVDTARYDEETARQRELQVERASRGLGPEFEVVGNPSKNQQQLLRVMGGVGGSGSNAVAAVPEAATR